jgi:hypothetical protein
MAHAHRGTWYALVLEQHPPENPGTSTWSLVVEPTAHGHRLLSWHCAPPPHGLVAAAVASFWSLSGIMERAMLLVIKERTERTCGASTAVASGAERAPPHGPVNGR